MAGQGVYLPLPAVLALASAILFNAAL